MLGEELRPSSELVCRRSGLATPHYYTARKLLVAKGAIVLRDRVKLAPIIELRMPAEPRWPHRYRFGTYRFGT